MRRFRHPPKRPASWFGVWVRLLLLGLLILLWSLAGCARAPELPAPKEPPQSHAARVALYRQTVRAFLDAGWLPLIDLEVSLSRGREAGRLIGAMDRAGVALAAVTSPGEATIREAVRRHPARLVPLTAARGAAPVKPDFLAAARRQLDAGAPGIGWITLEGASERPPKQAQEGEAGTAFEAILRLAEEKGVPVWLRMEPDDQMLGRLERHLLAHPRVPVVWTGAGYIPRPLRLPGYGHGLLRALTLRHPNLFFTLTQEPPPPRPPFPRPRRHLLYEPNGAFSPEWRAMIEARVAHFLVGSAVEADVPGRYAERVGGFRRRILRALSPPARRRLAYQNAWRLLTGEAWKD